MLVRRRQGLRTGVRGSLDPPRVLRSALSWVVVPLFTRASVPDGQCLTTFVRILCVLCCGWRRVNEMEKQMRKTEGLLVRANALPACIAIKRPCTPAVRRLRIGSVLNASPRLFSEFWLSLLPLPSPPAFCSFGSCSLASSSSRPLRTPPTSQFPLSLARASPTSPLPPASSAASTPRTDAAIRRAHHSRHPHSRSGGHRPRRGGTEDRGGLREGEGEVAARTAQGRDTDAQCRRRGKGSHDRDGWAAGRSV